jgi:hypothetical protein
MSLGPAVFVFVRAFKLVSFRDFLGSRVQR